MNLKSDIILDICTLANSIPADSAFYDRTDNPVREFLLDLSDCLTAYFRYKRDVRDRHLSTGTQGDK